MKDALTIFEHEKFGKVRTLLVDGEPWFVAKDIAAALGYKDTDDAIRKHCKKPKTLMISSPGGSPLNPKIIPESDIFRLVMRSQLKSAVVFQDWVCEEVLPAIRKTGSYSSPVRQAADERALVERRQQVVLEFVEWGLRNSVIGKEYARRELDHALAAVKGTEPQGERQLDVSAFLTGKGFGVGLLRHHASKFGKALKKAYVEKHGELPEKGWRRINGSDRHVFCYFEADADLFESTFEIMFGDGVPRLVTDHSRSS